MAHLVIADPDPALSHELAIALHRFGDRVSRLPDLRAAVTQAARVPPDLLIVNTPLNDARIWGPLTPQLIPGGVPVLVISDPVDVPTLIAAYRRGIALCVMKPFHLRELLSTIHALLRRHRRVVCLGGGTGLYTLLLGLKTLPNTHLTSIVTMSDDGGSAGRIREAFGILPPGDVRRSLVALSGAPALMNELIQYRFKEGEGLKDHNLGNLLLTAMASLKGSMSEAIRAMGDILNIQGIVLPVTATLTTLAAQLEDGTVIRGERHIDMPEGRDPTTRIVKLWQEPEAIANPDALSALLAADAITIGPGDLFTSIVATLVVQGVGEALRAARARTLYLCNLMTKPGETSRFTVEDHVREIVRSIGEDVLDAVLVSNTPLSPEAIAQYARNGQEPVRMTDHTALAAVTRARVVLGDVGSERELVRHDSQKLAAEIDRLLSSHEEP